MNRFKEINFKRMLRKKRSRAKVSGTQQRPRLTVFRSNRYIYAQLINDENGQTLAAASADNSSQAGKLIAERALKTGVKEAVFNKGFYKYHGRVKALAEEARKSGLKL